MDQPAATDIRLWSPPAFVWETYGFPEGSGDAALTVRVQWSVGTLYSVTGRTLGSITTPEEIAVAQKVITALTIMEAMGGSQASLEVLEAPWLKSFTAGSYSESRFSPVELEGLSGGIRGASGGKAPPFPMSLWMLMWALMTPAKRDEWMQMLGGQRAAAGVFIEPDWEGDRRDLHGPSIFGPGVETWG